MNAFLHVDFRRCTGCFACEAACRTAHGGACRVHLAFADGLPVPLMCRQCENSPCAAVCPEEALVWDKTHGVVLLVERCTRCGLCAVACPFGVLSVDPFGRPNVVKCDLCLGRRAEGKRPACVLTCPTEAITDEPDRPLKRRRLAGSVPPIAARPFSESLPAPMGKEGGVQGGFRGKNPR
ncbi:MAG: 4Fe-4S dicluster domain-containing protein [Desulfosoma sp.]